MSKIVTDKQFNILVNHLDAPFKEKVAVLQAIDFIREEKKIPCSVHLEFEANNKEWFYYGE